MTGMTRHHGPGAADSDDRRDHLFRTVDELDSDQAWKIISEHKVGHLALRDADDGVDIFPVNYHTHGGRLYFRSAPGTKLEDARHAPAGAFLIDDLYRSRRATVLVKGIVELVLDDDAVRSDVLKRETFAPGAKENVLRMTPTHVRGRLFRLTRRTD